MFSTPSTPSRQKMAFIWPYMCRYLEYILPSNFVRPFPILMTLYFQYTKNPDVKKWPLFELICAVHLEYILTLSLSDRTQFLVCSVHQEPSCQWVASIWAYLCRIHSNLNWLPCSNLVQIKKIPRTGDKSSTDADSSTDTTDCDCDFDSRVDQEYPKPNFVWKTEKII